MKVPISHFQLPAFPVILRHAAWDAVGEDELERERCLRAAERGRRWLEGHVSAKRLGALQHGGGQCIHGGFTEEVSEGMKREDALIFALDPEGEQMAHAIRVGGAPAVDCGTCRVATLSTAGSRAAKEKVREGEDADRQLRQESAEAEERAMEATADRQLRQDSMELDWPFSSLSSLSHTQSVSSTITRSMVAVPPPLPRGSTVERYIREGSSNEFIDLDYMSSGGSLTPRQVSVELVDLITPESTPEPREGLEEAVGRTMRNMDQVVTQFLEVRGQIEQLQDAVGKVEENVRRDLREQVEQLQAVAEKAEKSVQRETVRAERVIKEGVMEMLRIVEAGEKRVKGAVEAITPITQQQIVHAVWETMREELRATRLEWLEMMRAATQRSVPQPRHSPPFRVLPENISMHAPAPASAVSPSALAIVESVRKGLTTEEHSGGRGRTEEHQFSQRAGQAGLNGGRGRQDAGGGRSLSEETQRLEAPLELSSCDSTPTPDKHQTPVEGGVHPRGTQWSEVRALFGGIDEIDSQEESLGPTQILESQVPGAFPRGSMTEHTVTPVVPAVPAIVPTVPAMKSPAVVIRRASFSSESSSEDGGDPSFIRRVRKDWKAGSSVCTPSSLESEVVRDIRRRPEAAKGGVQEVPERLSYNFTPTPDGHGGGKERNPLPHLVVLANGIAVASDG
ncbi:hypothetical protein EV426DRAFT_639564 [Tirmania nivea]|nr:hypothetical protein EV426DRAFT_639564 [Tirmania nivea]